MAVGTWELAITILLLVAIPALIFLIVRAYRSRENLDKRVITRGLSGVGGSTVNLTCPAGQKISVYRAVYICTNPTADPNDNTTTHESSACDPFYQATGQAASLYNPETTLDVLTNPSSVISSANIVAQCNGQQKCTFSIPTSDPSSSGDGMCNGTAKCTGTLQLVGTYDCVDA